MISRDHPLSDTNDGVVKTATDLRHTYLICTFSLHSMVQGHGVELEFRSDKAGERAKHLAGKVET